MKQFLARLVEGFYNRGIPNLYLITLWGILSSGLSIAFSEVFKGTAIASSLFLFYIVYGYYQHDMYKLQVANEILRRIQEESQNDQSK